MLSITVLHFRTFSFRFASETIRYRSFIIEELVLLLTSLSRAGVQHHPSPYLPRCCGQQEASLRTDYRAMHRHSPRPPCQGQQNQANQMAGFGALQQQFAPGGGISNMFGGNLGGAGGSGLSAGQMSGLQTDAMSQMNTGLVW